MNPQTSKILIVEDDEFDAEHVCRCLEPGLPTEFEICTTVTLREATDKIDSEPRICLIIADLNLPDSKGLSTFQSLQDRAGAIPIIILTGTEDDSAAISAIHRGAEDYLVKGAADDDALQRILKLAIARIRRLQRPPLSEMRQLIGKSVGAERQYEVHDLVRSGTFSLLYRGRHATLDREVALKTPHPDVANVIAYDAVNGYLKVEAEIQHQLADCPRIVTLMDSFTHQMESGPCHFIVTEWIQGRNIRELLNSMSRPLPPQAVCRIMKQTCEAIAFAHSRDVIHRDVKPENLFLATGWDSGAIDDDLLAEVLLEAPDVRLTDFGLARVNQNVVSTSGTEARLKKSTGRVGGTHYLPPEVAAGNDPQTSSDIYAMGATFYELLTGHVPFRGANVEEVLRRHRHGTRPQPSDRCQLPNRRSRRIADRIVETAMAVEPAERYPDVGCLAAEIEDFENALSSWIFW